jgi:hypothetical protein
VYLDCALSLSPFLEEQMHNNFKVRLIGLKLQP